MKTRGRLTCEETFRRLDRYLDRTLSERELREVEAHLEACVACASEYRFEKHIVEGVRTKLRRIESPPGLVERILGRLGEPTPSGDGGDDGAGGPATG